MCIDVCVNLIFVKLSYWNYIKKKSIRSAIDNVVQFVI